ncbi:serine/threonine-protein kinase [Kitasatospora sp. NPDC094015]|uniref:serine/threonine-protein kinase n=1 Tax=Kitasatospora sp. NPDC094015 TaxID=3155205 RepID=UPI00331D3003
MTADTPRDAAAPLPPIFQPLHPDDPREVGGYRLFARLGAGGMGRVYLSYTPGGRPVALKVVRPEFAEDAEFRRRFAQEVTNAQRIHGLYTAQVIDSGLAADAPWLVTAYVPGPSLQQVVREHGALPVRTVLLLVGGIAEALQAIHSVEVVHRDLKPANVLIAGDGPRVIDFGIARAADATALTGTGFRIGSPAFMSPEQAQGKPVTPATDVFALGALAAYVAGGIPPFGEGPETAVLYRVVHEEPVLDGVPDGLRELLLRCLAKRPEDRPRPAEIIEAARSHPAVGGQLRFTDDWLPRQINTEITRRSDLPRTPPTPLPVAPTLAAPAVPPAPTTAPTAGYPTAPGATPPPVPATTPLPPAAPAGFGPPLGAFGPPQPATEAPTAPVPGPGPTALHQPSFDTPPPGPVVTGPVPVAVPAPAEPRRKGVSWKVLLTVALVMALGGTAGGVVLMNQLDKKDSHSDAQAKGSDSAATPDDRQSSDAAGSDGAGSDSASSDGSAESPGASPSPRARSSASAGAAAAGGGSSPSGPARYTMVYQDRELSSPDSSHSFDLANGNVVPDSATPTWALSPSYESFDWSSGSSDVYITREQALTPEQCSAAIDQHPAADLKYDDLPPGRIFCLRNRANGGVVVGKVVEQGNKSTGAVKISLTYYRNDS